MTDILPSLMHVEEEKIEKSNITQTIGVWNRTNLNENIKLLEMFPIGFYCYCMSKKADFKNLEPFLNSIDSTIKVYIVLISPSEGVVSPPYNLDFDKWTKHVKNIHSSFNNLNGIIIDDFNSATLKNGNNFNVWTQPTILKQLLKTKNTLETMKFHLVVYEHSIFDRHNMFNQFIDFITKTNMVFDDLIVPWKNLWTTIGLRKSILHVRKSFPNKKIIGLVYGCKTSWYPVRPFLRTYRNIATVTYELADSIIFYGLHNNNERFRRETTQLIGKWKERRRLKQK